VAKKAPVVLLASYSLGLVVVKYPQAAKGQGGDERVLALEKGVPILYPTDITFTPSGRYTNRYPR
jgi:hypothetical protein